MRGHSGVIHSRGQLLTTALSHLASRATPLVFGNPPRTVIGLPRANSDSSRPLPHDRARFPSAFGISAGRAERALHLKLDARAELTDPRRPTLGAGRRA